MKSFRPLLASEANEEAIKFPVFASVKVDGIRCVILQGKAVTRSLKPIPNHYIRGCLEKASPLIEGFDGELTVGSGFQNTTSGIMSHDGRPDFTYHVFDRIGILGYQHRLQELKNKIDLSDRIPDFIKRLNQPLISSLESLQDYYQECLTQGHEGIIVRSVDGKYKYGRSTVKEGILLKMKPFADSEARVIGFDEMYHNDNEKEQSELGLSKRSSKQEGKRAAGTLGKFIVEGLEEEHFGGVEFRIGTGIGLTQELRATIWKSQKKYLGSIVKFKYQKMGSVDKPRIPVFLGFRSELDRS